MLKLFVSGSEETFRLQFHLGGHFKRAGKNCYKTFYIRNLQMYVISPSVWPWQAFPALSLLARKARAYHSSVAPGLTHRH
jgi:hypothetical protein